MKVILIMDKPLNCFHCDLCFYDKYYFCSAANLIVDKNVEDRTIHSKCPLKPIPEIKYAGETRYNRCIDEILGETE